MSYYKYLSEDNLSKNHHRWFDERILGVWEECGVFDCASSAEVSNQAY